MNISNIYIKTKTINTLALLLGWMAGNSYRLRILTFHNIGNDDGLHTLNLERFIDFLNVLSDDGFHTICARDLVEGWPAILNQDRIVVLTFDDGYASHKDVVSEHLLRFNMTATFFVLSSLVDKQQSRAVFSGRSYYFLSWQDLNQMSNAGFEIGSHTHTHPLCGLISEEQFRQEIALSKQILENAIERTITSFSYPYGRQRAYSKLSSVALAETGYTAAFTQTGKKITPKTDLFTLPRINIDRFDTLQTFRSKLSGNYELLSHLQNYAN